MVVTRATVPPELHERYGLKPRNRFLLLAIWIIAGICVLFLFKQIDQGQQQNVETKLISWEVKSDTQVQMTWQVYQKSGKDVICILKAQDSDQFDVGFAIFKAEGTSTPQQFTHTLNTLSSAFAVLEPTCDLNESALLGSHFRPGLLPPAQDSPLFAPWQLTN